MLWRLYDDGRSARRFYHLHDLQFSTVAVLDDAANLIERAGPLMPYHCAMHGIHWMFSGRGGWFGLGPLGLGAAANTGAAGQLGAIVPWLILLIGLIIAGGVVIYFVRRWMDHSTSSSNVGFTLQDLREMHERGELSDEEFHKARDAMIGRVKQ